MNIPGKKYKLGDLLDYLNSLNSKRLKIALKKLSPVEYVLVEEAVTKNYMARMARINKKA